MWLNIININNIFNIIIIIIYNYYTTYFTTDRYRYRICIYNKRTSHSLLATGRTGTGTGRRWRGGAWREQGLNSSAAVRVDFLTRRSSQKIQAPPPHASLVKE